MFILNDFTVRGEVNKYKLSKLVAARYKEPVQAMVSVINYAIEHGFNFIDDAVIQDFYNSLEVEEYEPSDTDLFEHDTYVLNASEDW